MNEKFFFTIAWQHTGVWEPVCGMDKTMIWRLLNYAREVSGKPYLRNPCYGGVDVHQFAKLGVILDGEDIALVDTMNFVVWVDDLCASH